MAHAFTRSGRGTKLRYAAKFDAAERQVLIGLMAQTLDLVAPPPQPLAQSDPFDEIVSTLGPLEGFGNAPVPEDARSFGDRDPALQRLLPAGNREDEQAAAEFRRLTERGLRRRKADHLETAMSALAASGQTLELTPAQANSFLIALTDVRLVLGERMGLREDDDVERLEQRAEQLPEDHPVAYAVAVYDFLTWVQETLAHALMSGSDPGPGIR